MNHFHTPLTTEPCMCMEGGRKTCGKVFIRQFPHEGRFTPEQAAEVINALNKHDALIAFLAAVESVMKTESNSFYAMRNIRRYADEARALVNAAEKAGGT